MQNEYLHGLNWAFCNCKNLSRITIPESVTDIEDEAFRSCSNLTIYGYEGSYAETYANTNNIPFAAIKNIIASGITGQCKWELDEEGTLTISGNGAMEDYGYLSLKPWKKYEFSKVIIEDGVTNIGTYSFENCSSLISVTIPNSVKSIGVYAFYNCNSITDITIPDSVTTIEYYTFSGCSSLANIAIPDSVTFIDSLAFDSCTNLTSITIPNSVTEIEIDAFDGCTNLASITVDEGNTEYDSRNNCNAIIDSKSNTLILGCKNTVIPETVTSINSYAFYDCESLTEITIPSSVTSIGVRAFGYYYDENIIEDFTIFGSCNSEAQRYAKENGFNFVCDNHTIVTDEAIPATCTETGLTEGSHCSVCGEIIVAQEEIPALGHKPVIVPAVASDCQHEGHTSGVQCEHCGLVYVEWSIIEKTAHTAEIDSAVEPSCTETGLTEGSHCAVCGEIITEQQIVPALGHQYEFVSAVEPTYTKEGSTEGVRCKHCGEWLIEPTKIDKLPLNHEIGDVNFNNAIDIKDVTEIQKSLVGLTELSDEQLAAADVNGDGKVDINDVTRLQMYLAFLIDELS